MVIISLFLQGDSNGPGSLAHRGPLHHLPELQDHSRLILGQPKQTVTMYQRNGNNFSFSSKEMHMVQVLLLIVVLFIICQSFKIIPDLYEVYACTVGMKIFLFNAFAVWFNIDFLTHLSNLSFKEFVLCHYSSWDKRYFSLKPILENL